MATPVLNLFHTYIAASAFWYTTRAAARIYDPAMVIGWFRPPIERHIMPNATELYNIRTDAFGLFTIALILLIVSDAVPLPYFSTTKPQKTADTPEEKASLQVKQRYARAAIVADVFHHVMTGVGAWQHYAMDTHYNTSMGVGVWGCTGLAVLGIATLAAPSRLSGLGSGGEVAKLKAK